MFSSKSEEWETPQDLFDELNKEFHFTLDPCANDSNHKCDKWYSKEEDGLEQDWGKDSVVFINPPYGRNTTGKWVTKASFQFHKNGNTIVMLLPARTDTKWFHEYIYNQDNVEIRFLKGRLKFGGSENSAPFPSMICIWRKTDDKD